MLVQQIEKTIRIFIAAKNVLFYLLDPIKCFKCLVGMLFYLLKMIMLNALFVITNYEKRKAFKNHHQKNEKILLQ